MPLAGEGGTESPSSTLGAFPPPPSAVKSAPAAVGEKTPGNAKQAVS